MSEFQIVVVGASAGGVEALMQFTEGLPNDLNAPVLVVLHTAPTTRSALPQILSRFQKLAATYPIDGQRLQPGRIYIAPPDHHLIVRDDETIGLTNGPREHSARPAVDPLFRSAAQHFKQRAIGVVLSGTLDDGTAGMAAIKQAGGTTIVQDPKEALFTGMPVSVLEHLGA
jgi:two-component system chemotaxis response regulator CheB